MVMNHMLDTRDIKSASSNISGNHHTIGIAPETVKILQSLPLLHACMERYSLDPQQAEKLQEKPARQNSHIQ